MNKIAIIFILSFMNISCTSIVWKDNYYTEKFGGFYIEQKSNTLVAIGDKFHYIFIVDKNFIKILKLTKSIRFSPKFNEFEVTRNNDISGILVLSAEKHLITNNDITFIKQQNYDEGFSRISIRIKLNGKRYAIKESLANIINFKNAYKVKVIQPFTDAETTENILITPVAIAGDASAAVLLLPVGVLFGVLMNF